MNILIGIFLVLVFGVLLLIGVIKNLIYVCQPSEVLIFSGKKTRTGDKSVGYRIIKGGFGVRVPILEKVAKLDLRTMSIDVSVKNAYAKGCIPLTINGVANIKIAGEEPLIHNAIERFLGMKRETIINIAKQTLEGNLRGVMASLTPEQVNEDKIAFTEKLTEEAEDDFAKLGLVIDICKIQNITDDVNYLNSIGRKKNSEVMRDARITQANADADYNVINAENEKQKQMAKLDSEIAISKAEADKKLTEIKTKGEAMLAELSRDYTTKIVRAQADIGVWQAETEKTKAKLKADVIEPALAYREKTISMARADASKIVEQGKASIEGFKNVKYVWAKAGVDASRIFMTHKLVDLIKMISSSVQEVEIKQVEILEGKDSDLAVQTLRFIEKMKKGSGDEIKQFVKNIVNKELPPVQTGTDQV